jgi:hypothetical protein
MAESVGHGLPIGVEYGRNGAGIGAARICEHQLLTLYANKVAALKRLECSSQ